MSEHTTLLKIESIKKSFLKQKIIEDISLSFTEGDISLILGANGAGKTTLIKLAAGLLRPDKGSVKFKDSSKDLFSRQATYCGHETMLYQDFTVRENIELIIKLRKISKDIKTLLEEWQLFDFQNKKISQLSRGMRFRTALCRAFVHDPVYIFLDEPSSALDQASLEILSSKIKFAVNKKKGFAFIVTHDVERLAQIANRFIVLEQGKIAFDSHALNEDLMTVKNKAVEYYHKTNR